jgi:hypothetical protein
MLQLLPDKIREQILKENVKMTFFNEVLRTYDDFRIAVFAHFKIPTTTGMPAMSNRVLFGDLSEDVHSGFAFIHVADDAPRSLKEFYSAIGLLLHMGVSEYSAVDAFRGEGQVGLV